MVDNYIDGIESGRAGAVAGEDGHGERALQRGEAEDGIAIAAEDESDKAVAESADAVVEKDGVRHEFAIWMTLAGAGIKNPAPVFQRTERPGRGVPSKILAGVKGWFYLFKACAPGFLGGRCKHAGQTLCRAAARSCASFDRKMPLRADQKA